MKNAVLCTIYFKLKLAKSKGGGLRPFSLPPVSAPERENAN